MQAALSEEPLETSVNPLDEAQTNNFGAKDLGTIDSNDEGTDDL